MNTFKNIVSLFKLIRFRLAVKSGLTVLLLGFGMSGLQAQEGNTTNRGIMIFYRYVFTEPNMLWGDLIDNPYVVGGRKQAYWAEVNPEQGEYDWQEFDDALQIAHNAGKKVGLIIPIAGYGGWQDPYAANGVPDWVYPMGEGEGVDYLEWDGPPYTRFPVFWSNAIKMHCQTLVEAFGARYDGHPDLEYVIVGLYPEMNLGKNANDLQQEWLDAGYTDDLYENTVKWYIDLYAANFPDTQLSLACLSSKPIGLMSTVRFEELRNNISAHMDSIPNGGIENNALRERSNWDFIQQWFRKHHETTHVMYEAVDKSSGGGRAGNFRKMLENGLTAHADHFQIYYEDIKVATPGDPNYDPEYEAALAFAAAQIGLEPDDPARDNVWLRFNALIEATGSKRFFFQGLYCDENAPHDGGEWPVGKLSPPDGEYVLVPDTGSPSRECIRTNQVSGDNYIYLDVDDRFIYGGSNPVGIRIEYLDEGTDSFVVEYDGTAGPYAQSDLITKTNTGTWKTTTLQINDAVFNNAQTEGNDFRIYCNGDGDEYISFVQVTRRDEVSSYDNTMNPISTFNIYPNPTTGKISINSEHIHRIEIYNTSGERIRVEKSITVIDIGDQPKGLYLLRVSTIAGQETVKIVLI